MRTHEFLSRLDHDRIVAAIKAAESKTSGEIRILIERGKLEADPLEYAQRKFRKLGLDKTKQRNAVLIFVAPRAHKFAVVGDEAVHVRCGEAFWRQLVERMREHFRSENFTEALVHGIEETGKLLAAHFPCSDDDRNELPDSIIEE